MSTTKEKNNYDHICKCLDALMDRTAKIEAKLDELTEVKEQVSRHEDDIQLLKIGVSKVDELEYRIHELEQRTRLNNLEFSGIPVTANENTEEIILTVAKVVGFELSCTDIVAHHRVPSYNDKRVPNIICQLSTRRIKMEFLQKVKEFTKEKKTSLKANVIYKKFPSSTVFVNEHLSPFRKKLLMAAKQKKMKSNWLYVWSKEGSIYARKTDSSKVVKIKSLTDVDVIMV